MGDAALLSAVVYSDPLGPWALDTAEADVTYTTLAGNSVVDLGKATIRVVAPWTYTLTGIHSLDELWEPSLEVSVL